MNNKVVNFKKHDVIVSEGKYYKCRIAGENESYFEHVVPTTNGHFSDCGIPPLVLPTDINSKGEVRSFEGMSPYVVPKYIVIGNMTPFEETWRLGIFRQHHREMFIEFIANVAMGGMKESEVLKPKVVHSEPKCDGGGQCVPALQEEPIRSSAKKTRYKKPKMVRRTNY